MYTAYLKYHIFNCYSSFIAPGGRRRISHYQNGLFLLQMFYAKSVMKAVLTEAVSFHM